MERRRIRQRHREDRGRRDGTRFFGLDNGVHFTDYSADGRFVRFPLEHKHAIYYADKVKDLPVFLVVVDVTARRGWFLFVQPALDLVAGWRDRKSVSLKIPIDDDIADTARLRRAAEAAIEAMRLRNPPHPKDVFAVLEKRVREADPRFSPEFSFVNGESICRLTPLEDVSLSLTFTASSEIVREKAVRLIDKGEGVAFGPGEVRLAGSPLFDELLAKGGSLRACIDEELLVSFVYRDEHGVGGCRLDVPGRFTGGTLEGQFAGSLKRSPFSVKIDRLGPDVEGGTISFHIDLSRWNGQAVRGLAYFEQLRSFFAGLATSPSARVTAEGRLDGNLVFEVGVPFGGTDQAKAASAYFTYLYKAREVARHFRVNPAWSHASFNRMIQTVEEMYGVLYEDGFRTSSRDVQFRGLAARSVFPEEAVAGLTRSPHTLYFIQDVVYNVRTAPHPVVKVVREFTDLAFERTEGIGNGEVHVFVRGTENTVMKVRKFDPETDDVYFPANDTERRWVLHSQGD